MRRCIPVVGGHSPWGVIDHAEEIAEGVVWVNTSGHGGIWISHERALQLPHAFRSLNRYGGGDGTGGQWFEEDCEWCLVALTFPSLFENEIQAARETARRWYPQAYGEAMADVRGGN